MDSIGFHGHSAVHVQSSLEVWWRSLLDQSYMLTLFQSSIKQIFAFFVDVQDLPVFEFKIRHAILTVTTCCQPATTSEMIFSHTYHASTVKN